MSTTTDYSGRQPRVPSGTFEVKHGNLSEFVAVHVRPDGYSPSRQWRKQTKTVAHPRRIFWRKDGLVTVQAADKNHTVTFSPKGKFLVGVKPAGNGVLLNF